MHIQWYQNKTVRISSGNVRLRIQQIKANVRYFGRFGASSCSDIFDEGQVQQLCLLQKTQKHKQQEVNASSCPLLRV